jgi:hypothetical protein
MTSSALDQITGDFPEYDPIQYFDPVYPIYRMTVTAKVIEQQALSTTAAYVLRVIELGIDTIPQVGHALGLEERDVVAAAGQLLMMQLIDRSVSSTSGQQFINITPKGRAYIDQNSTLFVPRKRKLTFFFDPIIKRIQFRVPETRVSRRDVINNGMYVIDPRARAPVALDLDMDDLNSAFQNEAVGASSTITSVVQADMPQTDYLVCDRVYVLQHRSNSSERRLAVYHGPTQIRPTSDALQTLFREGSLDIPDDAVPIMGDARDLLQYIPLGLVGQAKESLSSLQAQHNLEREILAKEAVRDRQADQEEFVKLNRELHDLKAQLEDAVAKGSLHQDLSNVVRFLRTEEHRPILEEVLRSATERVIIISPWMKSRAFDRQLQRLVRDAIKRKVKVYIGYGFGHDGRGPQGEANRRSSDEVIRHLEYEIRGLDPSLLCIRNVGNSHQKVLICDRTLTVITSLNWLSFRGDDAFGDPGYRYETGTLLRIPEKVEEMTQWAFGLLNVQDTRPSTVD